MYGDHISKSITAFMALCFIAGGVGFAICLWLIPWLWSLVKPWLHMVTA